MALESVSNVNHAQHNFYEKNRDDGLKAAQLESSDDDKMAIVEDLEDGEILDDEEDITPAECPLKQVTESVPATVAAVVATELHKNGDFYEDDDSNQWLEDRVEKCRGKRVRPKHHRKRRREGEENAEQHDGKRAQHGDSSQFNHDSEGVSKRKRHHKGDHGNAERGGKKNRKDKGKSQPIIIKKRECMFWAQGRCHKGDDCPYSHSASPEHKMELCKFYLMDACAKREKCLYMHSDFPCKFFHTGMNCFSKEQCKFSHEPLTDITRAILLKHIDTAPKDILGDFPKLPRDPNTGQIILPKPISIYTSNNPSSSPQNIKKIPSLFDIEIIPPPELLNNLLLSNQDKDERVVKPEIIENDISLPIIKPQGFYHESSIQKSPKLEMKEESDSTDYEDFESDLNKVLDSAQNSDTEKVSWEDEDEAKMDEDIRKLQAALRELREDAEDAIQSAADVKIKEEEREVSPSPPPPVQDEQERVDVAPEPQQVAPEAPRWQLEDYIVDNYMSESSDDEDMLVMASFDDEEASRDTEDFAIKPPVVKKPIVEVVEADSSGIEDTDLTPDVKVQKKQEVNSDDETNSILQHLPKKQRELFLRIKQQQQAQIAESQAGTRQQNNVKIKQEVDSDNSNDESNNSIVQQLPTKQKELFLRIKHQQQAQLDEHQAGTSQQNNVKIKQEVENTAGEYWYSSSEDEGDEGKSLMNNVLHNLSNQPLCEDTPSSKNTTSPSIAQSVPRVDISSHASTSAVPGTSGTFTMPGTSGTASPGTSQANTATRDPRLARELQSQVPNNSVNRDPQTSQIKLKDTDLHIIPTTSKKQDLDMHISNNNKLSLNQVIAQSSKDTDLRQLNDTDLRVGGTPFKLPPLQIPCIEIDASLSSHPPIQYTPIPVQIIGPDYSKLNLDFNNPDVRNDPRLKKFVIEFDEKKASHSSSSRIDPRNQNITISDPRLSKKLSVNVISANTNSNPEQHNPNGNIFVRSTTGLLGDAPGFVNNVPLRPGFVNMPNQEFRGNWQRRGNRGRNPRFRK